MRRYFEVPVQWSYCAQTFWSSRPTVSRMTNRFAHTKTVSHHCWLFSCWPPPCWWLLPFFFMSLHSLGAPLTMSPSISSFCIDSVLMCKNTFSLLFLMPLSTLVLNYIFFYSRCGYNLPWRHFWFISPDKDLFAHFLYYITPVFHASCLWISLDQLVLLFPL